ncbi:MAG: hypothetical protein GY820_31895, partial [Gammaproteobacteria bacterium]|nr:hypothetical protein [Gammaproteobacteria bacterium]
LMALACQLHAPVHRSNHSAGMAEGVPYPDRIKTELDDIKKILKGGKYCDNPKALVEKLNRYSQRILNKINSFNWTITTDGQDYKTGNNGCAGVSSITNKPDQGCPCDRHHGLTRKNETIVLPRKTQPLAIGK